MTQLAPYFLDPEDQIPQLLSLRPIYIESSGFLVLIEAYSVARMQGDAAFGFRESEKSNLYTVQSQQKKEMTD